METDSDTSIDLLDDLTPLWWQGSILFFLIGDTATTLVGLRMHAIVEAGPVAARLVNTFGLALLPAAKIALVGGFYGAYRTVPHPHRIGVPLGLCALGFVVTVWNGAVIFAAIL
jgi:hypothetical protein